MSIFGDPQSQELVDQADGFDDEALAHLASKGLVRRANKLLAKDVEVSETTEGLFVKSGDWGVSFEWAKPVANGSCDCPTVGVCQHLLAAIMTLATHSSGSDSSDVGPFRAVMELADAELKEWGKMAGLRWALGRAASIDPSTVVVTTEPHLIIELPPPYASVRFMGSNLDSAVVKPTGRSDRRSVLLAVLCLWRIEGREPDAVTEIKSDSNDLHSERSEVLERAMRLCGDLLTIGLLHLGDSDKERLESLSASARGVKLYRLAVLAERAADQLVALSVLSPEADTARLLDQLCEVNVVSEATSMVLRSGKSLPDGLVGVAKARYEDIGQVALVGLGHYSWGDHRFAGSTGVFAESVERVYTASSPTYVNGRTLDSTIGWEGVVGFAETVGRHVSLSGTKASGGLRLSTSGSVRASMGGGVTTDELNSLAWSGGRPTRPSRLLGRATPNWVVIRVQGEESPITFDRVTQETSWPLTTANGVVEVRLAFRSTTATSIQALERIAAQGPPDFVTGRLGSQGTVLTLWPVSAVSGREFTNLATPLKGVNPPDEPVATDQHTSSIEANHLDKLSARLVGIADGGIRPKTEETLTSLASTAQRWGFGPVSSVIEHSTSDSDATLRAAWMILMTRDLTN